MSDYPEHEKLRAVSEQSQAIGEFLEWLERKGIWLCMREPDNPPFEGRFYPHTLGSNDRILAEYFDIDLTEIEREKRAMLEGVRARGECERESGGMNTYRVVMIRAHHYDPVYTWIKPDERVCRELDDVRADDARDALRKAAETWGCRVDEDLHRPVGGEFTARCRAWDVEYGNMRLDAKVNQNMGG